jgi:hypothetical protein
MTLAQIAATDFKKSVMEQYGIDEERLKFLGGAWIDKLSRMAEIAKKDAVCRYFLTNEGRQELLTAIDDLVEAHETARLHLVANLLAYKIKNEASKEILKLDPGNTDNHFSVIFGIAITTFGWDEMKKGIAIFEEASGNMQALKNMNDMNDLLDVLLQNPNFIADLIGKLKEADKLFHQVIPGGKFPPNDQTQAAAEIIMREDWTPSCSARYYYLNALRQVLSGQGTIAD